MLRLLSFHDMQDWATGPAAVGLRKGVMVLRAYASILRLIKDLCGAPTMPTQN